MRFVHGHFGTAAISGRAWGGNRRRGYFLKRFFTGSDSHHSASKTHRHRSAKRTASSSSSTAAAKNKENTELDRNRHIRKFSRSESLPGGSGGGAAGTSAHRT
jgi:hypothetical protein